MEKLLKIQTELNVPKSNFNKFGGYKYRSAEDILNAVKPLLKKHKCTICIFDEIEEIGGRVYVKSIVDFIDLEGDKGYKVSAYARESETKKGMDDSQITGAASSYARKYALSGLFLLDDSNDADATNKHEDKMSDNIKPVKKKTFDEPKNWLSEDQYNKWIEMIKTDKTKASKEIAQFFSIPTNKSKNIWKNNLISSLNK